MTLQTLDLLIERYTAMADKTRQYAEACVYHTVINDLKEERNKLLEHLKEHGNDIRVRPTS